MRRLLLAAAIAGACFVAGYHKGRSDEDVAWRLREAFMLPESPCPDVQTVVCLPNLGVHPMKLLDPRRPARKPVARVLVAEAR